MNVGDKITVLSNIGTEKVPEHGIVLYVTEHGDGQWRSCTDDNWRSLVCKDDEGVSWIHGHHYSGSPEVDAMRVAHALGDVEKRSGFGSNFIPNP